MGSIDPRVTMAIVFAGKPIIGITGGIGSGKTFVARLFAEQGCVVSSSDDEVRRAYERADVKQALREWWGESVFLPTGAVDRLALGQKVFANQQARQRLEGLIHPLVNHQREQLMQAHRDDPAVRAFVWDVPLLFETGLNKACDAVVFVDSPQEMRLKRVGQDRGWDEQELARREILQWPLDRKREISDYVIRNTADAGYARDQVRQVLSQILARFDH